jgi:hypothetical protein
MKLKSSRRRRWFFIYTRTILFVIAILAICFAVIVRRDSVRRSAAEKIEVYGGTVTWRKLGPSWLTYLVGRDLFATPFEVGFLNEALPDEAFRCLAGLEETEQLLIMQNDTFTGSGLRYLAEFDNLKRIHVYNAPVTDEGCAQLPELPSLEAVDLLATVITEESFPVFERTNEGAGRVVAWQ